MFAVAIDSESDKDSIRTKLLLEDIKNFTDHFSNHIYRGTRYIGIGIREIIVVRIA